MTEQEEQHSVVGTTAEIPEVVKSSTNQKKRRLKKPGRRPDMVRKSKRRLLDNRAIRSILVDIEEATGGRGSLLELLQFTNLGPDRNAKIQALIRWCAEPPNRHAPIHRGISEVGLSFKEFVEAYREAIIEPLKFKAELQLMKAMPGVVSETVKDARKTWKKCPSCSGKGQHPEEICKACQGSGWLGEGKLCNRCDMGTRPARACGDCSGTGRLELRLNMESRKLAFEAAGMTGKSREVNVAVQTNIETSVPSIEDAAHRLPDASEAIDITPEP